MLQPSPSAPLSDTDARTTHSHTIFPLRIRPRPFFPSTVYRVDLPQDKGNIQPSITMPAPIHALMEFPAAGYDCLVDAHTPLGSNFPAAEPHHQELVVAQLLMT
jgi:hypothetical protein